MLVSVIIKSRNEADRLRLVLASLGCQTVPIVAPGSRVPDGAIAAEIIVVNDASTDHTHELLEQEAAQLPLRAVHHAVCRGRAAASNAGARVARGELLLFLDGDTLAAADLVERHAQGHAGKAIFGRGETYHLRCTRFFRDPETGTPQPGGEAHVARMGAALARNLVTREQVVARFDEIAARAELGLYPGAGPRRLCEAELAALTEHSGLRVLWLAAAGQNASLRRTDFEAAGGFDERLTLNEHRELALRLHQIGIPVAFIAGARSYHLTHRTGWRDPIEDKEWEKVFYDAHPCLAVKLMAVFWLSLTEDRGIPENARIRSLAALDAIVRQGTTVDYDAIRRAHPRLGPLGIDR